MVDSNQHSRHPSRSGSLWTSHPTAQHRVGRRDSRSERPWAPHWQAHPPLPAVPHRDASTSSPAPLATRQARRGRLDQPGPDFQSLLRPGKSYYSFPGGSLEGTMPGQQREQRTSGPADETSPKQGPAACRQRLGDGHGRRQQFQTLWLRPSYTRVALQPTRTPCRRRPR